MAAIYFPNGGELILLENGISNDSSWSVKLFANDHTPAAADQASDYTEASFDGYAAASLTRDGAAATDGDGKAAQEYARIEWTFTGSDPGPSLYGFFIVDAGGALVCACRFDDAPVTLSESEPDLRVVPKIRLHNP